MPFSVTLVHSKIAYSREKYKVFQVVLHSYWEDIVYVYILCKRGVSE